MVSPERDEHTEDTEDTEDEPRAERLQKLLARGGVASRRKAEELIAAGRVSVDGVTAQLGERARRAAEIRLDGRLLQLYRPPVSYLLNKPRGYVTTAADERGRPTVLELVPEEPGLHPVGRLDLDSEGLLLLTTDGDLTLRLTHPRYGQRKEYRVWCVEGQLSAEALRSLLAGVLLDDGPAAAVSAAAAPGGATIVLGEGRKRQVRRMLAEVGYEVERLKRTRVAGLELGDLPTGSWRLLQAEDFGALGYNPA